jgi:hypothetical protein
MSRKKSSNNFISEEISTKRGRPRKNSNDRETLPPISEAKQTLDAIEHNRRQILEMQTRILSAPAMNGGFSTLMYKIDKIEQSQNQLVEKVDEVRNVLYDPDNGLYARIKTVENDSIELEKFEDLEEKFEEIKIWKNSIEKLSEKEEIHDEDIEKIIRNHDEIIKELQRWYQRQAAITKWLTVTLGTGIVGAIGKLIHFYFSNHIQII